MPDEPAESGPAAKARRFAEQAIHARLGIELEPRPAADAPDLVYRARLVRPADHLQVEGVVHGGILTTLADTAGVWCVYPDLPGAATVTSVELKLNFLAPALGDRGPVVATARPLRLGRRVRVSEVELEQAGRLVAKGLFTYLVLDPSSA